MSSTYEGAIAELPAWIMRRMKSGFMRDLADVMETCKDYLDDIDPNQVAHLLDQESSDLRRQFVEMWNNARVEIAGELRLGQGNHANYRYLD